MFSLFTLDETIFRIGFFLGEGLVEEVIGFDHIYSTKERKISFDDDDEEGLRDEVKGNAYRRQRRTWRSLWNGIELVRSSSFHRLFAERERELVPRFMDAVRGWGDGEKGTKKREEEEERTYCFRDDCKKRSSEAVRRSFITVSTLELV